MRHIPSTNEASFSGSTQLAGAQALQRHQEHLLHEVVRRMRIAQVPQAVQAHARRQAAIELGFGCGIDPRRGRRNARASAASSSGGSSSPCPRLKHSLGPSPGT